MGFCIQCTVGLPYEASLYQSDANCAEGMLKDAPRQLDYFKIMLFNVFKFTVLLTLASYFYIFFWGIPRNDVLICEVPSQGKFVLKSSYRWDSFAKYIPAHVAIRWNRRSWKVDYFSPDGAHWKTPISIIPEGNIEACAELGVLNGVLLVSNRFYKKDGARLPENIPPKLHISKMENVSHLFVKSDGGESKMVYVFYYGLVAPFSDQWVFEIVVSDQYPKMGKVVAVAQSVSFDAGKNWTDLKITEKSKIYKIGVDVEDQPFLARPISLNGEPVNMMKQ